MSTTRSLPTGTRHRLQLQQRLSLASVPSHFAPGVESLTIEYAISGLTPNRVVLRITSATYPGTTVFERPLTAAEKAPTSSATLTWDGRASAGARNGQFMGPVHSPYQVVLESDAGHTANAPTAIEIVEITLTTTASADHKIFMNDPAHELECAATVKIKKSDNTAVETPIPIEVDYTFTDPATANATKAASYNYSGSHFLGKVGDAAARMWRAHADCAATSTDAFATVCKVATKTAAPELGQAKVYFKPAGVGGDDYKLKAKVMAADGTTELAPRESDVLTVWRSIDFANVYTMAGESYVDTATTHAEIGPAFETNAFVKYSRQPVNTLDAALTVRYIGLYQTGGGSKNWPADFAPATLETSPNQLAPTAAELAAYAATGTDAATVAAKAAAKTAIEAKAQLWFNAVVDDYVASTTAWFSAVTIPAGNALLAVQYYHPKLSNAGDGATTFWPAGISINLANPGSGMTTPGHPDQATWRAVQGFNRGTTSVIFKNYGTAARLQIVCRHEIGHGTSSAFQRAQFGTGDHSASGLMTPYGGSNAFSNADIDKLKGLL